MNRILRLFPVFLVLLILTACANAEDEYRLQIKDALADYDAWNQESVAAYNRLQESNSNGNPEVSYGELITNTIQSHIAGDQRRADLTWDPADFEVFKGQAQMVYDGARPLLSDLQKMPPPEAVKDAHLVLQECVKYEMNIAATILIFFNDNKFEPVNYAYKPCDTVDTALLVLRNYAESNQ